MSEKLKKQMQSLYLSGIGQHYEVIFETASQKNWTYCQLLESLFDLELDHRLNKRIQLRLKQAKLPSRPTIDSFDFERHASRKKSKGSILRLMQLDFIKSNEDVILIGNPGVGKTHVALCLGHEAAQRAVRILFTTATDMINHLIAAEADHSLVKKLNHYTEPDLLICDEIGYLPLDKQGSNLFFQVISSRHQRKSTILTTNLPFAQWGNLFDSTTVATAIADRLVMNSEVIILEGESYRRSKRKK